MSTDPRPTDVRDDGLRLDRRELLARAARGAAGLAAAGMGGALSPALAQHGAHFAPKAKRCLFLFMFGGPSQMDLFDYKPELQKRDGQSIRMEQRRHDVRESTILGSRRTFRRHGETGQWCSDALPRLAQHMDKLAVVKSLWSDSFAHGSGLLQMNTGRTLQGYPALGAWLDYGLGSENPDLPGFVVMHDPRGGPISGPANWSSGFMPANHQGTLFRSTGDPLLHLAPSPASSRSDLTRAMRAEQLDVLAELDRRHAAERAGHTVLDARTQSYGLAHRMSTAAREALDLRQEDERTRAMYQLDAPPGEHELSVGPAPFGRQCLMARRLLERGVRCVQIYHGGGHQQQSWDAHHGVEENLSIHCPEIDGPISALLTDLERTGLLDETLVVWGGEFGRLPVAQQAVVGQVANAGGRGHNPKGFTVWLAGAGIRPGSYGETDELGYEAAVNRHHLRDLHATILHLMGLDHERLTYRYAGLEQKLTTVFPARVIDGILT